MSGTHGGTLESVVEPPLRQTVGRTQPGISAHPGGPRRSWELAGAGIAYLALSVFIWWGLWSSGGRTTCGCGDSSTFIWYIEWPAYAIAHGLNPFYSTALFHPGGVDLLSNTSVTAVGIALAPITWIFGPVATFNLALTLSPALSALAMFVLLRRWVTWAPAAFGGGLCYGFSSFVLDYLSDGHLMIGLAVVPPLVVLCLDELLFRQQRRPVLVGCAIGLLVTAQFFMGTEVLLITIAAGFVGVVLVVVYGAVHDWSDVRRRAPYAATGLAAGAVTAGALLAYPVWFALAGPAHLSGSIWPGAFYSMGGTPLRQFLLPTPPGIGGLFGSETSHRLGGYQGPILTTHYLGVGLVVVVVAGTAIWRRDRRLWLFGTVAALSLFVAFGYRSRVLAPWHWLSQVPEFENVIPERFVLVTFLAAAVLLGLIIDHIHAAVSDRTASVARSVPSGVVRRWGAAAAGVAVGAIALLPPAIYLAQTVPMTTQPTVVPDWFRKVATHLSRKQVLLVLPAPFSGNRSADFWQAQDRVSYSMVGGPGPGAVLSRAGREGPGQTVLSHVSAAPGAIEISSADIEAVRQAIDEWKVTEIVVPDQPNLPAYDQLGSVTTAAALITGATGQLPLYQSAAWVWRDWDRVVAPPVPTTLRFFECTNGLASHTTEAVKTTTACVLNREPARHAAP